MKTVTIHDAKTNLSKYIAAAKMGDTIYIGKRGTPEVKLVVMNPSKERQLGPLKGKLAAKEVQQLLDNDKTKDSDWQNMVQDLYDRPIA